MRIQCGAMSRADGAVPVQERRDVRCHNLTGVSHVTERYGMLVGCATEAVTGGRSRSPGTSQMRR